MAIAKNINLNKLDRKFLNDSMKEPMLSRDEEKKLAEAWVFKSDKKAMHKIIKAYSKLVNYIQKKGLDILNPFLKKILKFNL